MPPHSANTLYYGDNLPILREYIPDASVDLIYLDPPFNSSRNYTILFKDEQGKEAEAAAAGVYSSPGWGRDYPRLQILTIAQLLGDTAELQTPPTTGPFKAAQQVAVAADQHELW
jgi:hypothetical protein